MLIGGNAEIMQKYSHSFFLYAFAKSTVTAGLRLLEEES